MSALLLVGIRVGCAGPLARANGSYRHRALGYVIGEPPGPVGYWRRFRLDEADLAFRGGRGERMSLGVRCVRLVAPAWVMARQLRIGLPEHRLRSSGPASVLGREAWAQLLDARVEGVTVRVKAVTLVAGDCSYDWVLAARDGFEDAEPLFDAWRDTFRLPDARRAEG